MNEDPELLRRFAEQGDDDAFRQLVDRHLPLVYSSALRQLNGDAHLAADVAQVVFTDLARKARTLAGHRVLAAWLFTSTRFSAAKVVRTEQRRRTREQEAQIMEELNHDPTAGLEWTRVRPVLDAALSELADADREAILLRYFEHRDYREIGQRLSVADNTARMRVERALDKLRAGLERRGVTSTSVALAAALGSEAVAAVPAGLAANVAGAAMAAGATTTWLATFMSMTKLQVGITGAVAVAAATGYVTEARSNQALRAEVAELRVQAAESSSLRDENVRLARASAEAATLRGHADELARLSDEATALQRRLAAVSRLQASAAAATQPATTSATYDIAKLDRLPRAVHRTPPTYPFEMRRAGIEGQVVVEFIVDTRGEVQGAKAVKSTRPEFEGAAVEAIQAWKFEAGNKGGRAVNTYMQVPIVFSLSKADGVAGGMTVNQPDPEPAIPAR